jgi:hypothetical protein
MKISQSLQSGLAGAAALTLAHEVIRKTVPAAPRMDRLGMTALAKLLRGGGAEVPTQKSLFLATMAGDLLANAVYYSLTGVGEKGSHLLKGSILGLSAGLGAVVLPKHMGLPSWPSSRTTATKVLTVGIYFLGGIVAASVLNSLERRKGV